MSDMSHLLDAARLADLDRDPNHVAAAIANFEAARDAHPRLAAERVILRTVSDATKPRDVSQRAGFDPDYGAFTGHPMDPRTDDAHDETLSPEDADSEAADYILSHAESTADWLAKACDCEAGRNERDVSTVSPLQIMGADPALLFAVVMTGDNEQVVRAAFQLRELAARDFAAEIKAHALRLLAEVA